jgi:hypothetical protein
LGALAGRLEAEAAKRHQMATAVTDRLINLQLIYREGRE